MGLFLLSTFNFFATFATKFSSFSLGTLIIALFTCSCVSSAGAEIAQITVSVAQFNEHCDIWTFLSTTKCLPCTSGAERGGDGA